MWKAILALALALPCLARAELLPDAGFGSGGTVDIALPDLPFGSKPHVTVLPDRRVVVAVVRGPPGPDFGAKQPSLWLARLQPDGSIDPTFGNGAPVLLDLSPFGYRAAGLEDIGVRPDGSLYALVLFQSLNLSYQMSLVSVTADGRFDPAFNGGAPLRLSNYGYWRPKAFDTGSGYLVVGVGRSECCGLQQGFDAWRVRADGTLDPAFGNGGSLAVPGGSEEDIGSTDVMPVPGGGFQILNFELSKPIPNYWRRYRADGSLDAAFGNGGDEAIPDLADPNAAIRHAYPLGDGTYAGVAGGSCVQRVFDAQGSTLSKFDGLCTGGGTTNPQVQPYGAKILVSAEQRFGGVPPPSDGTYLWVLDRNGAIDRAFAEPQGDRWRPTTNPNWSYQVAADADRGVVLASAGESSLRVERYVDVRRGVASDQPIPALGVPALLLLTACAAAFARRRFAAR